MPNASLKLGNTEVLSEASGVVTLANTVSLTDEYYLQGKVQATYTTDELSSAKKINFDGSTAPYWSLTGDTTNFVQGTTVSDLKIIKSGIYLINFSLSCGLQESERFIEAYIYGVGSASTNLLARSSDGISFVDSDYSYGNGSASLVYKFNANDQISFAAASSSGGNADIRDWTHFNICLIRPLP